MVVLAWNLGVYLPTGSDMDVCERLLGLPRAERNERFVMRW